MTSKDLVAEIVNQFGLPNSPKDHIISQELVKKWMNSKDIDVLGVVSSYLLKKEYTKRIEPQLTFDDVHPFIMSYFERCLLENPDGDWTDSSYEAAWSLANWFNYLWSEKENCRKEIEDFKLWLGNLYKNGDDRLQDCIVNGIVEHLFEEKKIKAFFKDWQGDSALNEA
jgi:hypothetical protein